MNWEQTIWDAIAAVGRHIYSILTAVGFGGGVYALKLAHHWPAPSVKSRWYAAFIDALWDLVGSKRMGERRDAEGNLIIAPAPLPAPAPERDPVDVEIAADYIARQEAAAAFTRDKVTLP